MAYVYGSANNTKPTTWGFCNWNLISTLIAAGWVVKMSGDGLAAYSSTGSVFTNTGNTGANGFDNSGAWIRLAMPDGVNEIVILRGTANTALGIFVSKLGFTGGTPSATLAPTATDSFKPTGVGVLQPTTANATSGYWATTMGSTFFNCAASNAAPYTFYGFSFLAGPNPVSAVIICDSLTGLSSGVNGTDSNAYIYIMAGSGVSTSAAIQFYGIVNSGVISQHNTWSPGSVTSNIENPFTGGDDLIPFPVSSLTASATYFRGYSSMFLYDAHYNLRSQFEAITYNSVTRGRILIGNTPSLSLPWDGSAPILA